MGFKSGLTFCAVQFLGSWQIYSHHSIIRSAAVSSKYPHGSPTSSSLHHPKHAAAPEFPSISLPSPFPECPIGKITQNVVFSNWLLSNINWGPFILFCGLIAHFFWLLISTALQGGIERYFGYFQFGGSYEQSCVKYLDIGFYVAIVFRSIGWILRSMTARPHGKAMFCFTRNCSTLSQVSRSVLCSRHCSTSLPAAGE